MTDEEQKKRWYTCSFCGRESEVRPHAPLMDNEWHQWKFLPMRLCFFCASIQENIREMLSAKDGN